MLLSTFERVTRPTCPFPAESFDLIVCQAAFKNFKHPITALNEMHRVLRPGGVAVMQDMTHEARGVDIDEEVPRSQMRGLNAFMTKGNPQAVAAASLFTRTVHQRCR